MMAPAESPASAVTRVSNTMHGRKAGEDDGDDDLLVSNTVISLKDPLSGTRIQTAARLLSHPVYISLKSQLALHKMRLRQMHQLCQRMSVSLDWADIGPASSGLLMHHPASGMKGSATTQCAMPTRAAHGQALNMLHSMHSSS